MNCQWKLEWKFEEFSGWTNNSEISCGSSKFHLEEKIEISYNCAFFLIQNLFTFGWNQARIETKKFVEKRFLKTNWRQQNLLNHFRVIDKDPQNRWSEPKFNHLAVLQAQVMKKFEAAWKQLKISLANQQTRLYFFAIILSRNFWYFSLFFSLEKLFLVQTKTEPQFISASTHLRHLCRENEVHVPKCHSF